MRKLVMGFGVVGLLVAGGCQAPSTFATPLDPETSDERILLGEYQVYFDEAGRQQFRAIATGPRSELGVAAEPLTEVALGSGGGRGANPASTAELITCRPTTVPTCDTPYGAGSWIHVPAGGGLPEGGTSDPAICGAIPAGQSSTCLAYDMEPRAFVGAEISNVQLEFLSFRRVSTGAPIAAIPYGGAMPQLGLGSPGTTYRFGTLEVPPPSVNLLSPPHQAGLRKVRISFPAGFTAFMDITYIVRIFGTVATAAHAPHQVSVTGVGDPTPEAATQGCITSDSDFTVFASRSPLVPEHTGTTSQIYRVRRRTGRVELLSRDGLGGAVGDGDSTSPCITPDGSVVVFESDATNLVVGDVNGVPDVFSRVISSGVVDLLSRSTLGPSASQCGRGGGSNRPQVSDNGVFVAFASTCASLCGGPNAATGCFPGRRQVYRFNRTTTTLEGVSVRTGTSGTIGPSTMWGGAGAPLSAGTHNSHMGAMSYDGLRVAFVSTASSTGFLAPTSADTGTRDVFVRDMGANTTTRISDDRGGAIGSRNVHMSADGLWVAFETASSTIAGSDTNGVTDVLRCFHTGGMCEYASVPNGSAASVRSANGGSAHPFLSTDGHFMAFESAATNLVPGDTNGFVDVFVRDMSTTGTTVHSVNGAGVFGDGDSTRARLTRDGIYVQFQSGAENLQEDSAGRFDADGTETDVFVMRRF